MKLQKLRNSRQFRRVYDQGQRFHTPHFSAFILGTGSQEHRVGITVTRKVGNAVLRNRCKRRLRVILRKILGPAPADLPGYDLVLNAKHALADAPFDEIEAGFVRLMARYHESLRKQ